MCVCVCMRASERTNNTAGSAYPHPRWQQRFVCFGSRRSRVACVRAFVRGRILCVRMRLCAYAIVSVLVCVRCVRGPIRRNASDCRRLEPNAADTGARVGSRGVEERARGGQRGTKKYGPNKNALRSSNDDDDKQHRRARIRPCPLTPGLCSG